MRLLAIFSLLSASAFAGSVTISVGGAFTASAPTSPYSAPNATWTLSFQVPAAPIGVGFGTSTFDTQYTNGVFTLNGNPIFLTGSDVSFATASSSSFSTFDIFLDNFNTLSSVGVGPQPQLFTGPTGSPTMVPGSYLIPQVLLQINTPFSDTVSNTTGNLIVAATPPVATPEPSSVTMVSIGLAALALVAMLRRKQSAA